MKKTLLLFIFAALICTAPRFVRAEYGNYGRPHGPDASINASTQIDEGERNDDSKEEGDMEDRDEHKYVHPGMGMSVIGTGTILDRIKERGRIEEKYKEAREDMKDIKHSDMMPGLRLGVDRTMHDLMQTRHDDFKKMLEGKSSELRAKIGAARADIVIKAREDASLRFTNALTIFSSIAERLDARIAALKAAGKDTAAVEALSVAAKADITAATSAFDALKAAATADVKVDGSVKTAAEAAKTALKKAQESLKKVHMALKDMMKADMDEHASENASSSANATTTTN